MLSLGEYDENNRIGYGLFLDWYKLFRYHIFNLYVLFSGDKFPKKSISPFTRYENLLSKAYLAFYFSSSENLLL